MKDKFYQLLRWSEKYTKTDMVYLAEGNFWLTTMHITSTVLSLLTAIAFARYFPKEAYGTYKYIISIASIVMAFSLTGIGQSIVRSVSRGFDGIFKKAFLISIKWSALSIAIALIGSIYYFINNNTLLGGGLLIIALMAPFQNAAGVYGAYLQGKKNFKTNSQYMIIYNIIVAIVIITASITTDSSLKMVATYFILHTTLTVFFYLYTIKKFQPNNKEEPETITYGKHLSVLGILTTISNKIDSLLVFHYLGAVQLAVYSFALALPQQIRGVFKNLYTLAIPKMAERNKKDLLESIFGKMLRFTLLAIPITLVYIFLAPFIFKFFFPQYIESVKFSQIYSIMLIIPVLIPGAFFHAQMSIKESYLNSVIVNSSRILLTFFLVISYGIWGAITAHLISRVIALITSSVLIMRMKVLEKNKSIS